MKMNVPVWHAAGRAWIGHMRGKQGTGSWHFSRISVTGPHKSGLFQQKESYFSDYRSTR
jgi:hypothetical protein